MDFSLKDAATQTSLTHISESMSTLSTSSWESQETLKNVGRLATKYRNVATETDFPMITSLTSTLTSTDLGESDYPSQPMKPDLTSLRKDLPVQFKEPLALESSESHNSSDQTISSEERLNNFALKYSKSRHVKKQLSSSDEDGIATYNSNLQKGHVFVYMIIPPDGGYGWLIMFISFLCQVVVDGIIFGIGILLPHIAKEFGIPGSKVVLVASMQVGFYFLAGAVSSAFINNYGFRPVAMAGCLLSITVLTIATFSTDLLMMTVFYSILGGPGLSMIWVSSQLIIGYYFEKYRPIANGLSCSGAGVGIMIFSFMNNMLLPHLGWRNLMRVHVGCLVLVLLMSLTFVEVAPTRIGRVKEVTIDEESDSDSVDFITNTTRYSRYSIKLNNQIYGLDNDFQSVLEQIQKPLPVSRNITLWHNLSNKCCPCIQRYLESRQAAAAQQAADKTYVIRQDLMEKPDLFYTSTGKIPQQKHIEDQRKTVTFAETEWRTISLDELENVVDANNILNTLSTMNINRQQQDHRKSYQQLRETKRCPLLAFLKPSNLVHPKIRNGFRLLFDFRLLAIPEFRLLLASAFLFPMGFNIPFVYSTVRAQIEPNFAKLISPSIGFSNFAFRIASGFVAYKFREYTTYICGAGMVFGGLAVFVSAFYGLDAVWFQFLYAICYGIAPAFYSTLRAIIYVRSLGLDKLTNAFGLTALAMGMGVFIGTTAGGIFNDLTGDYTASFAFAGICIIIAGIFKLLLPYLTTRLAKM